MIIDTLDNLGKYVGLNPLFADVVSFLKENDLSTLEDGKHPIKCAGESPHKALVDALDICYRNQLYSVSIFTL